MKKLILIQNDYSGAGKSTIANSLHQYLSSYRIPHHHVALVEDAAEAEHDGEHRLAVDDLRLSTFVQHLNTSDLVIMEVGTGLSETFYKFYYRHELEELLSELEFSLTVLLPVTSEEESFDEVITAAEVYSDTAQYLIAHTPASANYDDDLHLWEHSHAARVMDLHEAVDVIIPATPDSLHFQLKVRHTDLAEAMSDPATALDAPLHGEISTWFSKVAPQLNTVRNYLFGDTFRPTIMVASPKSAGKKTRGRKPKATMLSTPAESVAVDAVAA